MPIPAGYQELLATPKSSRNTEAVWSFLAEESGESVVLPDGRCDIIVRSIASDNGRLVPVVTGPATKAYTVTYDAGDAWYGIRLRPEHAGLLWGHRVPDAQDSVLRGAEAITMVSALGGFRAVPDPIAELTRIAARMRPPAVRPHLTRAIDVIHTSGGRIAVQTLARHIGCSSRHLNRLFRAHVGLNVKTYIQLAQFHRALRLLCQFGMSIVDAAFEGGFADHAHLTRTFQRFGGFAPTSMPKDLALPTFFHP